MRILDRYIIKPIFFAILSCILLFCFLYIIVDIFGHLDEIIRQKISLSLLIDYYLAYIPFIFTQITPIACLLSTLYVLGNLCRHNEIIAMRSAGISTFKIIRGLIREKWNYDGLLIAEDLMEYPLSQGETYSDIALKMIGIGIDILSISHADETELLVIADLIRSNLSEDSKQKINSRLSNAISNILPIEPELKEFQPPVPQEQTLIAKQEPPAPPATPEIPPISEQQIPTPQTEQTPKPEEVLSETPTQPEPMSIPQTLPTETIATTPAVQEPSTQLETTAPEPEEPAPPFAPAEPEKQPEVPSPAAQKVKESKPTSTEQAKPIPEPKPAPPPEPQEKETPPLPKTAKITPPPNTKPILHKISKGETLFSIARRYGVTPKEIITWNNIDNPNLIKYGLKLTIYVPETSTITPATQHQPKPTTAETNQSEVSALEPISLPPNNTSQSPQQQPQQPSTETAKTTESPATSSVSSPESTSPPPTETIIYTVKHGDTLDSIAREFRTSKEEIIQLNNLKKPYILPAGRKLRVPKVPKVSFNQ